jgi:uncharacterized protein with von Willebrand factor type A (vWA) domain
MNTSPDVSSHGHLLRNILRFGRFLRTVGIEVTSPQMLDLVKSLQYIDIRRRDDFQNSARTVLVNQREQMAIFDQAFDSFWKTRDWDERTYIELGRSKRKASQPDQSPTVVDQHSGISLSEEPATAESKKGRLQTYSNLEVLLRKDFARLTLEEVEEIEQIIQALPWQFAQRRTRRKVHAPRGSILDMRRMFRTNIHYGGEPLDLSWRHPKNRGRPIVVICDVSGSMEQYSRTLLKFIYSLRNGLDRVESFVFSTRLTRLTRQLKGRDIDLALDRVMEVARDWGGGTRIGEALKTFNYRWGRQVLNRGAIVLLISDGLDRGDIDLLAREMQRLRLSCKRVIWLNPWLGSPNYQPLARGIQAALPYIDDFLPIHNLASLAGLLHLLETLEDSHHGYWNQIEYRRNAKWLY